MHFGATPEEWQHFADPIFGLGLTQDLLPVVSNPGAIKSPDSKVAQPGKVPTDYNQRGEYRGFPNWTSHVATERHIERWQRQADYGICVQTRTVRAIDVDVEDDLAAREIEQDIEALVGALPMRWRADSSKFLLTLQLPGAMPKRVMKVRGGGIIEFLATGQQFVAIGTHPRGEKYQWSRPDGAQGLPEVIPTMALEQFEALWSALEAKWAVEPSQVGGAGARERGDDLEVDDPVADYLYEHHHVIDTARDGALLIRCPWAAGHSSGTDGDTSTVWFPAGSNGHAQGAFKCLHGSCSARTTGLFLRHIGFTEDADADFAEFASATPGAHDDDEPEEQYDEPRPPTKSWQQVLEEASGPDDSGAVFEALARANLPAQEELASYQKVVDKFRKLGLKQLSVAQVKRTVVNVAKEAKNASHTDQADVETAVVNYVIDDEFGGRDVPLLHSVADVWWVYDKGRWRQSGSTFITGRIHKTILRIRAAGGKRKRQVNALLDSSGRGEMIKALTNAIAESVKWRVALDPAVDPLGLLGSDNQSIINCQNGELHFNEDGTFELQPHNPEHHLTSQVACDYDPDARCPRFSAALQTIFGRLPDPQRVIDHWCELMGCMLQPTRPDPFFLLIKGPGANGKSTIMNVVERLMGPNRSLKESIAAAAKGTNAHFSAGLVGRSMFLDDDVEHGVLLPDGLLKTMAGASPMTANPKNAAVFDFTCRATPVLLSNHWPRVKDYTDGFERRAQVIELEHVIPHALRDTGLLAHVAAHELPGVLNLFVSGWGRVLQRGGKFDTPTSCLDSRDTWLSETSPTQKFIRDCLVPGRYNVPALMVWKEYRRWMEENEENSTPLGRNKLYDALKRAKWEIVVQHGQLHVRGCSIEMVNNATGVVSAFPSDAEAQGGNLERAHADRVLGEEFEGLD